MYRDASGRLHLAVAVYGPWSTTLGYDLDWLYYALPPRFLRSRKTITWESVRFLQVQVLLPAEAGRRELVQLHVSSVTGTIWHPPLGRFLVEHADGVVFAAPTSQYRLEHTIEAHERLNEWRARQPLLYQFDDSNENAERLTPGAMAAELAIGDHTWFSTRAFERHDVRLVFREITARLVDAEARGALGELPLCAPIERLTQP